MSASANWASELVDLVGKLCAQVPLSVCLQKKCIGRAHLQERVRAHPKKLQVRVSTLGFSRSALEPHWHRLFVTYDGYIWSSQVILFVVGLPFSYSGLDPGGFCICQVWVWVEIFTHGFACMGHHEVTGWVRVLHFTHGCPLGLQKSWDLFKYSTRSNIFIYATTQQPGSVVSLIQLIKINNPSFELAWSNQVTY
jgi:hypothetical protein